MFCKVVPAVWTFVVSTICHHLVDTTKVKLMTTSQCVIVLFVIILLTNWAEIFTRSLEQIHFTLRVRTCEVISDFLWFKYSTSMLIPFLYNLFDCFPTIAFKLFLVFVNSIPSKYIYQNCCWGQQQMDVCLNVCM